MSDLKQAGGSIQQNINTILLSLTLAGIIWTLKSINELDSRMATQEASTAQDHEAIQNINRAMGDQSKTIYDINSRLNRVEAAQSLKKSN